MEEETSAEASGGFGGSEGGAIDAGKEPAVVEAEREPAVGVARRERRGWKRANGRRG